MTDILERLRAAADDPMWAHHAEVNKATLTRAADEIERLRSATALCEKHQPNGGARGHCVICAGEALSAALSRISYLCGPPNEMECGPYDLHCDEGAVVEQVERLRRETVRI